MLSILFHKLRSWISQIEAATLQAKKVHSDRIPWSVKGTERPVAQLIKVIHLILALTILVILGFFVVNDQIWSNYPVFHHSTKPCEWSLCHFVVESPGMVVSRTTSRYTMDFSMLWMMPLWRLTWGHSYFTCDVSEMQTHHATNSSVHDFVSAIWSCKTYQDIHDMFVRRFLNSLPAPIFLVLKSLITSRATLDC